MSQLTPTDAELGILQILWRLGPSTVRQVNDILNEEKEVGYTTTLKIMQIMAEKAWVERDTNQKVHIYTAAVQKETTQKQLLNNFLSSTFSGAATEMVLQALGQHQPSSEELDEIKAFIASMESKNNSNNF